MLTPRENHLKWLREEPCEWTPTSEDRLEFRPTLIKDNVARAMVVQQVPYTGEFGGKDIFDIEWYFEKEVGGSMEVGILFEDIEEWEQYVRFPNLDELDWEGCAKENAEYLKTDKIVHTTIFTGFFERLISFVGFERAAMALVDEDGQQAVHVLFDKIADLYIDMIARMHKYFNVEMVEIHDDWGTQRGLMFSPNTHREMIMPYLRRVADAAHEMGVFIELHSCGKIDSMVPNIIDCHVDTWRGQAIVDKAAVVAQYGDRFKFGVEVRNDSGVSDEEALELVKSVIEQYKGKRVWLAIGRLLTPTQRKLISDYVHSVGVI